VHVGDVHLDGRQVACNDGVAQGVAVVAEGARVDDQSIRVGLMLLDEVNERALVVGLAVEHLGTQLFRASLDALDHFHECVVAIDLRLTHAEHVEVGAVE
jgi:hypothetical protein